MVIIDNPSHFIKKVTHPPRITPFRLFKSIWRQKSKTPNCPDLPRLDGKLALVTGGNDGIGLETCKGLAERGAEVIILARNEAKSRDVIKKIRDESGGKVHFVCLDLANLESIFIATNEITKAFSERKIALFVANAGISPKTYSESSQGYEKAFAVNVLGHHVLLKACLNHSLLHDKAHIIVLAGDIYILENDCTSNYTYESDRGGMKSYCRSKLGIIWWAHELLRKYPNFSVNLVHPGVVATNLSGESQGFVRQFLMKIMTISPKKGAQTSLICATQPGIVNGGYYHNTMGRIILSLDDSGADYKREEEFWNLLEDLTSEYLDKNKIQ